MSPSAINDGIRAELAQPPGSPAPMTEELASPLRYRGLAEDEDRAPDAHVERVLAAQGARRIVIGHTVTLTAIVPRYDARVVNVEDPDIQAKLSSIKPGQVVQITYTEAVALAIQPKK